MNTLKDIQRILQENAGPDRIAFSKKMIPAHQKVYGVKVPVINELAREYKNGGVELAVKLWQNGSLEECLLAAKILGKSAKKNPEKIIRLVYEFSDQIKDWAVCDTLGMQSLKPLVEKYKDRIWQLSDELIESKNLWQRRLALVVIEYYTRHPDMHFQIKNQIEKVRDDKEYYVKKAIRWLERNMKK